ncbi:MAG: class II aldolase/adducin family protein [Kiritimatiellae bacterium]|nr:class II aldolase/adducin family protein [Kiritimatiellia bacterium]
MDMLKTISKLSHAYGTAEYVKAGGGNTSCKDAETLWIKPSGTTLAGLKPETFVMMDRTELSRLYEAVTPVDSADREALVKNIMASAVKAGTSGRPSVEAPLHDSLSARYVVHTHPPIVNGMTCAADGRAAVARLFPDALWVPYIDPGYMLCMSVRRSIHTYKAAHGVEPRLIFLQNHGVFVSGDTEAEIRGTYTRVFDTLKKAYRTCGVAAEVCVCESPSDAQVRGWRQVLSEALGEHAAAVAVSGRFEVGNGPISPDHIVYAKSYAYEGGVSVGELLAFVSARGYTPRVIVTENAVLGVGTNTKTARLALELALDGALVKQLAYAFGGLCYLSDVSRLFIENWEVESYRAKQAV